MYKHIHINQPHCISKAATLTCASGHQIKLEMLASEEVRPTGGFGPEKRWCKPTNLGIQSDTYIYALYIYTITIYIERFTLYIYREIYSLYTV